MSWFFAVESLSVMLATVSGTLAAWFLAAQGRRGWGRAAFVLGMAMATSAIAAVAFELVLVSRDEWGSVDSWSRLLLFCVAAVGPPVALGAFLVSPPTQSRRRRRARLAGALVAVLVMAPPFAVVGALCVLVLLGDPWPG